MAIWLTEYQAAYLAGLVDGEGSLECQRQMQPRGATPQFVVRLSFCFATPEPLATLSRWFELPVKMFPATDPARSPRYRMHLTKGLAVPLLKRLSPHLILKKREAELLIAIDAVREKNTPSRRIAFGAERRMPPEAVEAMEQLWRELRSLKSNKRRMDARVNLAA